MGRADEWRRRASRLRRAARDEKDPVEQRTLLLLADDCDEIATKLERSKVA
jgi:hypothetical protein